MNDEKTVVYDPNPIDLELELFNSIGIKGMNDSDLSKPETVRFLIHSQRIALSKLKLADNQIKELQFKNENLIEDREALRIAVAKKQERHKVTLLDIPISILSGFSINMLTNDISNGVGWILFIISLLMLIFLRGADILKISDKKSNKEL